MDNKEKTFKQYLQEAKEKMNFTSTDPRNKFVEDKGLSYKPLKDTKYNVRDPRNRTAILNQIRDAETDKKKKVKMIIDIMNNLKKESHDPYPEDIAKAAEKIYKLFNRK